MFHTFLKTLCVIDWIRNVLHQHNYPSTCKEDYGGMFTAVCNVKSFCAVVI